MHESNTRRNSYISTRDPCKNQEQSKQYAFHLAMRCNLYSLPVSLKCFSWKDFSTVTLVHRHRKSPIEIECQLYVT